MAKQKRRKPTLKQTLIIRFMKENNLDAVTAAHAADAYIKRLNQHKGG